MPLNPNHSSICSRQTVVQESIEALHRNRNSFVQEAGLWSFASFIIIIIVIIIIIIYYAIRQSYNKLSTVVLMLKCLVCHNCCVLARDVKSSKSKFLASASWHPASSLVSCNAWLILTKVDVVTWLSVIEITLFTLHSSVIGNCCMLCNILLKLTF